MEKTVFVDNLKINLKVVGQGEPILILHGWSDSFNSWVRIQEILAEKGFKVFIPDLPGFGKSDTPKSAWGIGDYSDFIFNLSQKLNLSQFFLVGHSFGGRISIKFVNNYPEKVNDLVLVGSGGIKLKLDFKTKMIYRIARMGKFLFTKRVFRSFQKTAKTLFYFILRKRDYIKAQGIMRQIIKKAIAEDLLPEACEIKTKTLVVWGERDKSIPVEAAYIFKREIKNSQLKIFPKIGHNPHKQIPEKLAETINNFFKKINCN
jgi:pimeloyl-ACP methyl ester carboxylesterase